MGISQERIDKTNNLYKYTIGFNDILFYIGVFTSTLYTNFMYCIKTPMYIFKTYCVFIQMICFMHAFLVHAHTCLYCTDPM